MTPTPATPARTASDTATATADGVTRHARTSTAHQRRRATSGGGILPNDKASTQGPNGPPRATKGPRRTSGPADGRKAATGHENGHHGHGRTPNDGRHHGGRRKGPPASTPASHTDGRHHGGRPRRRPVLAATSTASYTDTATDGGPHGPPLAASTNQFWGVRREPCLYSSACQWKCDQHTSKSGRGRRGHRRRGRAEVARREFF